MNSQQNNRNYSSHSSSSPFKRGGGGGGVRGGNGVNGDGGKKFCSVCQKKGLPESVYTSHFTKTQPGDKGIVVCPTILNAKCNYCGENGHWANINYCAAMKYDEKMKAKSKVAQSTTRVLPVATQKHNTSSKNFYDALDSDDEDKEPAATNLKGVVPIVQVAPVVLPKPGVGWAEMAKKAPVVSIPKPKPAELISLTEESKAAKMPLGVFTTSKWSSQESSDEGDEEEYYEEDEEYYSEEMENNYPDTGSDEPENSWK